MPRCKNCKEKFEQYQFNNKFCKNPDCLYAKYQWIKQQEEKKRKKAYKERKLNNPTVYTKDLKQSLQSEINKLIKYIDKGVKCIDCHRTTSKPCWDAGHFVSVGSNHSLRYNLHNIFIQTRHCNSLSEGNKLAYYRGIIDMYGQEYANKVESQAIIYPLIKIKSIEYPDLIRTVRKINSKLKAENKTYSPEQRIQLRDLYQKEIGIYN